MIFDRGQPVFVDTSERVKSSNDILPARDYLYKALMTEHLKIQEKLSDEKIETAYVELFKFHPSMRSFFTKIIGDLQDEEKQMFAILITDTQSAVMTSDPEVISTNTAALGNSLREKANKMREDYVAGSSNVLAPAENFLSTLIVKSDSDLLDQTNLKAP
jgi:hypothetical protein